MNNQILTNLKYAQKNQKEELKNLFNKNINIQNYFETKIKSMLVKWQKEHSCFDIPSGIVSICINDSVKHFAFGPNKYNEKTIFDIASMSKLYNEIIIFDFIAKYGFSLHTKIKEMVNFYKNIGELTIMDLLSFNNEFKTKIDVRYCHNKKEAKKALRTTYIEPEKAGYYKYTDLPSMILTDIMETLTKKDYEEIFEEYIIKKYDLKETYIKTNSKRYITINKGLTNDPKANIMGGFYGHCGVKTTPNDFIKFLSTILSNKHHKLFTTVSKTLKEDGSLCINKAHIGNINLPVLKGRSLASSYVTGNGFAIQGSVRCHGETCDFKINNKKYRVTSSIFLDLYTQYDNVKKYEKETGKVFTREYDIDGRKGLKMSDVRTIIPYTGTYKDITNLVGICRTLELYKYLKNE